MFVLINHVAVEMIMMMMTMMIIIIIIIISIVIFTIMIIIHEVIWCIPSVFLTVSFSNPLPMINTYRR